MDIKILAEKLLEAVDGLATEDNIRKTMSVFEGFIEGVDRKWEEHIAAETGELLMYDELLCECGRLIEITRSVTTLDCKISH